MLVKPTLLEEQGWGGGWKIGGGVAKRKDILFARHYTHTHTHTQSPPCICVRSNAIRLHTLEWATSVKMQIFTNMRTRPEIARMPLRMGWEKVLSTNFPRSTFVIIATASLNFGFVNW